MGQIIMKLSNICKSYNGIDIYRDFSINFREGARSCLFGPSGCGKTTLLNIIGGIVRPDSGLIEGFDDKRFSYIFQEPRLLPWKTVRGNIEFVLDGALTVDERRTTADTLIHNVDLQGYADYYPSELSGGMKQRVSIARAFAIHSDIILMDEPLNGLDSDLKKSIIDWFSQIWRSDMRTVIFVTHDSQEALLMGDEIFYLSKAPVKILKQKIV